MKYRTCIYGLLVVLVLLWIGFCFAAHHSQDFEADEKFVHDGLLELKVLRFEEDGLCVGQIKLGNSSDEWTVWFTAKTLRGIVGDILAQNCRIQFDVIKAKTDTTRIIEADEK